MGLLPSIHQDEALELLRRQCGLEPEALQSFRNRLLKQHRSLTEAVSGLPVAAAEVLKHGLREHVLATVDQRGSRADRAEKILLQADDGSRLETVLMASASGRPSVCVSSQVGCAMGCRFCATGGMGFQRNLTVPEILDQVVWANQLAGHRHGVRNVVFMGMGEPLLNTAAVFPALERLISPKHFALSPRRIMVSTSGLPDGMRTLAQRFPVVSQALSLHSARQDVRESLMPVARHCPLPQLRAALEAVGETLTGGRLMIEVLLLKGINDSEADAHDLGAYLVGLPVYVNILSYNSVAHVSSYAPSEDSVREAFSTIVESYGFMVTQRYSLGADIGAACGQLVASNPPCVS